ncbi:2-hydroxyacyl-CoA dehydratase subunit D [Thermodesulfobacteriota bacterium]
MLPESVAYIPSQNQALVAWKDQGKAAIGYFCASFPKEIIYAADIFPVRIMGSSDPIEYGYDEFCRFTCCLSRSAVDLAFKGNLEMLDGVVFTYTCDVMHFLAPRWQQFPSEQGKFWYYLTRPTKSSTEGATRFLKKELSDLKQEIETYFKVAIKDDDLKHAIAVYNEQRELLRDVDKLKKEGFISCVEAQKLNFKSMLTPPEEYNTFLQSLITEIKKEAQPQNQEAIKLFLAGATLPDTELFELIEEEGATVIEDDLCVGSRYRRGIIPADQDPLTALARYYLADDEVSRQCSSMLTENRYDERLKYIEAAIKNHDIKGVIFTVPYNCDKHYWDVMWLQKDLLEKQIPSLILQPEGHMKSEAIRTRVAAFLEMLV